MIKIGFGFLLTALLAACASTPPAGTAQPLTNLPAQTSSATPSRTARHEETQPPDKTSTLAPSPALPIPSEDPTPTAATEAGALFLPECDSSGEQVQTPTVLPSDFQAGWNKYINAAYHFSFSFPPDWNLLEGPHYLCLNPPSNPNLRLVIGFKSAAEEVVIQRSGVGAGDISVEGNLNFLGGDVSRDMLSYQGKDKAVLYNQGAEIKAGEALFSLSLDDFRSDYETAEIPAEIQDFADQIVESFALEANASSPIGTAMPFASGSIGEPETVFTIRNDQPYSGRAGEPRPDWLAWGAQALAVAADGSFWIADSAAEPPRLLHYSPAGEQLRIVSLEGQIVGLTDVEADEAHVWALGIASMHPKVVRFSPNGTYQASFDLPEGLRLENGLTGIALAKNGALLVEKGDGILLYQLIDPSGKVDLQLLKGYPYKGFLYGVINGRLSPGGNAVESTVLQPDHTFAGLRLVGVAQDTNFYVEVSEMAPGSVVDVDRFVQHYKTSGDLLGVARLPKTEIYGAHDLALGPDGQVYFLVSQPDHSLQVQRLRFGPWPVSSQAEAATPTVSPTPLTPLLPAWETPPPSATDPVIARQTLLNFFTYLDEERYAEAAELFGGSYEDLPVVRDDLLPTSEDKALVWEIECLLLRCHLLVSNLVEAEQVSPDEFAFIVEFADVDGTLFVRGPCCGASEADMPPVWQFPYTVKKVGGQFKVIEPPVYVP